MRHPFLLLRTRPTEMATTTTENMTGDNDSDGENAAEMNDSGSVSSFHDGCPFSFC